MWEQALLPHKSPRHRGLRLLLAIVQFAGCLPWVVQNETGPVLSTAPNTPAWLTVMADATVGLISAPSLI